MKSAPPRALALALAPAALVFGCSSAAPDPAPLAVGARTYQKCYACHSLEGPDPNTQGPSLKGIVGRAVAAEPGFAYSASMRAYASSQGRWTPEALEAFIADPQAVVPDNEMGFFGIRNADERRALIAYLARS